MDLELWKHFLTTPRIFNRPFMDVMIVTAEELDMYSDASKNFELGFGAYCGTEWSYGKWSDCDIARYNPSIEYLELFWVTVAVLHWLKLFKNKRIVLLCDNEAVVHMINNTSSSCKNCMVLL